MTNMLATIVPKSDQLNADDLIGRSITIEITKVSLLAGDQPVSICYKGDNGKPYKPCKSMRRVLVSVWGSDGGAYVGRFLTLYRDEKVTFGGMAVGGIRISHMSHIDKPVTLALTATRANRKPFTVQPLVTQVDDIERIKEIGRGEADKGSEALKAWWGSLGGARQKQLGTAYLDEVKTIAADADTADGNSTEFAPLEDRVNTMLMELAIDREQIGTDDFQDIASSEQFKTLWTEVKASDNKELLRSLSEAMTAQ